MEETFELLKKKAITHIWQNPRRDKQCIIQLSRISPKNGYVFSGRVGWDELVTPTEKGFYHFYQIGDNMPSQIGLVATKNQWYRLSDWCKEIDLVVHCYNKYGKCIPLDHIFTYRTYNDNIIIAILRNDKIFELNDFEVYIHFYQNYYYKTKQEDNKKLHIGYVSNIHSTKVSSQLVLEHLSLVKGKQKGIHTRTFRNGRLRDGLATNEFKVGDVIEGHYDMSVYGYQDFPLDELRTFKSTMDSKTKYVIHPKKDKRNHIVYRDDIDIYICKWDKGKDGRYNKKKCIGLYYHRNMEDSVRMLTHRDYSLPVAYVQSYMEQLNKNPDIHDYFIRIYFRDNGIEQPIIDDVNNIKALYQMSDTQIVEAMAKVNSTIPEWTADSLESSAYTALMRSYREEITPALVLDAMGYNSTVKLLANPNLQITRSVNGDYFTLPEGLYKNSTIFEYNANGLLLGWYLHSEVKKYYPRNPECVFIEALAGKGTDNITLHIGSKPFKLAEETSYRFYSCRTEGDKLVDSWEDITGSDKILIDGLNCTMKKSGSGVEYLALGDNTFLCYEKLLDGNDGLYDFKLTYNGTSELVIPPGKLDIWMNGYALVEDIDYYVDFPNVNIVNKKYATGDNDYQKVVVRGTGFPFMVDGHLKRTLPRETGFVQYGKVSVNNHYDLHCDKILRTVVNGGVFDPSVIPFDDNGTINLDGYVTDGLPYSIETPYIAMVGTMNISLYQQQIKDYDLTKRISDYLTTKISPKERVVPPHIPNLYPIFSTFLSKITADLRFGRFQSPPVNTPPMTIDKIIAKYKKYLAIDPIKRGYDKNFVSVHPHNQNATVELSARDLEFIRKLNELYLDNQVETSVFYRVRKGK